MVVERSGAGRGCGGWRGVCCGRRRHSHAGPRLTTTTTTTTTIPTTTPSFAGCPVVDALPTTTTTTIGALRSSQLPPPPPSLNSFDLYLSSLATHSPFELPARPHTLTPASSPGRGAKRQKGVKSERASTAFRLFRKLPRAYSNYCPSFKRSDDLKVTDPT